MRYLFTNCSTGVLPEIATQDISTPSKMNIVGSAIETTALNDLKVVVIFR